MLSNPETKYRPFPTIDLPDRQWPSRRITKPPRWLSTDLRDGNQALIDPMDGAKKHRFFDMLVEAASKEIEVGFPAASNPEFNFVRSPVEGDRGPEGVKSQVLRRSRQELLERTFESLRGAPEAIMRLYHAVSPVYR